MTVSRTATPSATTTATWSWRRASRRASSRLAVIMIQQQQQQKQLTDNTVDPNCPRCGQPPQTLEHWLDCPGTLLARLEIFGTTEAPPLSRLSSFPGKSVALARRTPWRLGAHATINTSSSSISSSREATRHRSLHARHNQTHTDYSQTQWM